MKPKLLLGDRGSGKTIRILETVKWLKAAIISPSEQYGRDLKRSFSQNKGYRDVIFISCNNLQMLEGREFDIICVDEWKMCETVNYKFWDYLNRSKIQPVLTESLDTEYFDVEVM